MLSQLYDRFIRWWTVSKMGVVLLLVAIPGSVVAHYVQGGDSDPSLFTLLEEFYANTSWELIGIAVTVLIIDNMYRTHEVQQEKDRLMRQLSSPDEHIAFEGLERMRAHGWLEDSVLQGASLQGANLHKANLQEAHLQEAHLQNADLRGADLLGALLTDAHLHEANLEGANLHLADLRGAILEDAHLRGVNLEAAWGVTDQQLMEADALLDAIMPNGERYDGRLRLSGDIAHARQAGFKVDDPTSMARFYVVPVSVYLRGQAQAKTDAS